MALPRADGGRPPKSRALQCGAHGVVGSCVEQDPYAIVGLLYKHARQLDRRGRWSCCARFQLRDAFAHARSFGRRIAEGIIRETESAGKIGRECALDHRLRKSERGERLAWRFRAHGFVRRDHACTIAIKILDLRAELCDRVGVVGRDRTAGLRMIGSTAKRLRLTVKLRGLRETMLDAIDIASMTTLRVMTDENGLSHRNAIGDGLRGHVRALCGSFETCSACFHALDPYGLALFVGIQTPRGRRDIGLEFANGDIGGVCRGREHRVRMRLCPFQKRFRARGTSGRLDRALHAVVERGEIGGDVREHIIVRLGTTPKARARRGVTTSIAIGALARTQIPLKLPLGGKRGAGASNVVMDRSSVAKPRGARVASRGALRAHRLSKLREHANAQGARTFSCSQSVRATPLLSIEERLLSMPTRIAEPPPELGELLPRPTTIFSPLGAGLLPCVHGDTRTCVRLCRALAATRALLDHLDDLLLLDHFLARRRMPLDTEIDEHLDRVAEILGLLVREHNEVDAELELEPMRRQRAHVDRPILSALELNEPRDGTREAVVLLLSISGHDDDPLRRRGAYFETQNEQRHAPFVNCHPLCASERTSTSGGTICSRAHPSQRTNE